MLKSTIFTLSLILSNLVFAQEFGEKIETKEKPMQISELKKMMQGNESQEHLVIATTDKVCKKKGCWMSIKDGEESIRVKFKDYSFFVPKDVDGRQFLAKGKLIKKKVSEADRRHYAKDAKASQEEIDKIKGDKFEFMFIASGVKFL